MTSAVPARDTIFALSSGRPPAAIAVVRMSGPHARAALEATIGRVPKPRHAALATVRNPAGESIDQALALWFPAPRSETGEDMAELQLHGGRAVIAATLEVLAQIPGLRPAEAGEFTRRAFENGRLDLTAVEGLADLIGAETEAQRRQALRQLRGFLSGRAEAWRTRLIEALALVEAGLDFSDEADVPEDTGEAARKVARGLRDEVAAALANNRGERLRDGFTVAIAGPVNAGKSSLLNWLAGRPAAIVSPYPGTTRDVIEVHLELGGYPVILLDTAGLRESSDPVEQEGIRRAQERAAEAELVLWVVDASEVAKFGGAPLSSEASERAVVVLNKIDLINANVVQTLACSLPGESPLRISAKEETGLPGLLARLQAAAEASFGGEDALVTRSRHRHALTEVRECLDRALATAPMQQDLFAEELRLATRALGRLTGRIDVEDVLDVIFRDFCIGK